MKFSPLFRFPPGSDYAKEGLRRFLRPILIFQTCRSFFPRRAICGVLWVCLIFFGAGPALAGIMWSGDFRDGDFTQWRRAGSEQVDFYLVPEYGRPVQYSANQVHTGSGELLSLVARTERTRDVPGVGEVHYPQGPTRGSSEYAAKFTLKNSANGAEPADCDPAPKDTCHRRRSQLQGEHIMSSYGVYQNMNTYWGSISFWIPSDFNPYNPSSENDLQAAGGAFTTTGIKPKGWPGSGIMTLSPQGPGGVNWTIVHRWGDFEFSSNGQPNDAYGLGPGKIPWWQAMTYNKNWPAPGTNWTDMSDYPDPDVSRAALASVARGEWTDWVWQIRLDPRGSQDGGTGFWNFWKREGDGPWIHVLAITPKVTTRGGRTFDHGIGYGSPNPSGANTGLYTSKDKVWLASNNTTFYLANIKVGDANATFADMSPDGSTPHSPSKVSPKPPLMQEVD